MTNMESPNDVNIFGTVQSDYFAKSKCFLMIRSHSIKRFKPISLEIFN